MEIIFLSHNIDDKDYVRSNNCKATGYWKTNSVKYNFLLIAHEYLFVFRK